MTSTKCAVSALAMIALSGGAAMARDQIQMAGSSTVLPYATIVAEAFGENFSFPTPVVQSGGSSAGLKAFCEGDGENTIDIANSSRLIRSSEVETCKKNGVNDIIPVQFGYDGIVFANLTASGKFAFNQADWFKALAATVVVDGKAVANPYTTWDQVNPAFPKQPILAFIPGTKHGTREVFDEKVIIAGCESSGAKEVFAKALDKEAAAKACSAIRTDGKAVDIDGDYTETLNRISTDPNGIGVFGLAFYENNTATLKVATMNGIVPSVETIAKGEYPVSRPLQFYVKKSHIGLVPGLKEYIEFFVSDDIAGPNGPLAAYGIVPDPELAKVQAAVAAEETLK